MKLSGSGLALSASGQVVVGWKLIAEDGMQMLGQGSDGVLARRIILAVLLLSAACGRAVPAPFNPAFASLLAERKFEPGACYTGADRPEDRPALQAAVDNAIRDVAALPPPIDRRAVHDRLQQLIRDVDGFATEDRDESYRYAIRIWRAAGLQDESHLFAAADARILAQPC